ncbi:hemicentin-1-like [Oculina patagonica]
MFGIQKVSDTKLLQLFCLLVCVALPLPSGCAPSFTGSPNNGNPVYQLQGNDMTLSWFYNPDGKTVTDVEWSFYAIKLIATKFPTGAPVIEPEYQGRVEVSGDATIKLLNIQEKDSGKYECRVSFTTSPRRILDEAELIVVVAPQITVITTGPITVDEGNSGTLLCVASGNPKPLITWYRGSTKVQEDPNNSNYTITSATRNHAGTYRCEAVVTAPGLNINPAEYTVAVTVRYRPTVTNFTTGTPGNSVVQGTTVTLTCSANGYPAPTYTIKRGNTVVNSVEGKHVIPNIQLSAEADTYSCEPQNSEGTGPTEQLQITIRVPPTFSSQLPVSKTTKTENETVSYSCTVEAKPAATIQWILNGQNLTYTPPYNISSSVAPILNSKLWKTLGYFIVKKVTWRQHGNFSCLAFNNAGKKSQITELEVRYRPVVQFPEDHPKNLTLAEGATATFFCKTIGNPATQSHQWQFHGYDIPGESCSGCLTTTYTKAAVTQADAGWYSCTGTNTLGEGPPARAQLLIKRKYPPAITYFPQNRYTVNETSNVTMVCRANGVPTPRIIWRKSGSYKELASGEEFSIVNTSGSDDGTYTCTAKNYLGQDSREITLNVRTRPTIVTSTPTTTQIPGTEGEQVDLTCIASGKPSPSLSWKRQFHGPDLSSLNDNKVKSIAIEKDTSVMKVTVSAVGEKFFCVAVNLLGRDNQEYTVRERGVPDAPIDVKLVAFKVEGAKTVNVHVNWTPGYSGGYDQEFTIHYRVKGSGTNFVEQSVGHPDNNKYTVQGLLPNKTYEFTVQASNQAGKSQASAPKQVMTPESSLPPDRGIVKATRMADDPTVILVTWTVTDPAVTTLSLEIQEGGEGQWEPVKGASGLSKATTEFKVTGIKADKKYRFKMDMRRPEEQNPVYVYSNFVSRAATHAKQKDVEKAGLSTGAVSGIVIAIFVVIILACLAVYVLCFKTQGSLKVQRSGKHSRNEPDSTQYAVTSSVTTQSRKSLRITYV